MSSWCCSTPCPPSPLPPVSFRQSGKTTYPQVTAAPYAVMASDKKNGSNAQWWGPVFLQHPGQCLVGGNVIPMTLYMCDKDKTPISVYVLNVSFGQHNRAGLPVLSPRSCLMRVCTSSRDQIQRNREENIRINVQNGTWCKTPMSSSEFLEYSKAMNGVQYVYTASGCC